MSIKKGALKFFYKSYIISKRHALLVSKLKNNTIYLSNLIYINTYSPISIYDYNSEFYFSI